MFGVLCIPHLHINLQSVSSAWVCGCKTQSYSKVREETSWVSPTSSRHWCATKEYNLAATSVALVKHIEHLRHAFYVKVSLQDSTSWSLRRPLLLAVTGMQLILPAHMIH